MPRPAPPKVSSNPGMLKSWDFTANKRDPNELPQTSREICHWVCVSCGHKWTSSAFSRLNARSDCPSCALRERSRRRLLKVGCLATNFPDISKEWDKRKNPSDLLPTDILPTVKTKVWWRCAQCDNSWLAKVESRTNMGAGCPVCALKRQGASRRLTAVKSTGSLSLTHPDIASEWHPTKNKQLTAEKITGAYGRKVWWRCPKGHDYQARPQNRTYGNTGCPLCRPQTSLLEIRILSELEALIGQCHWRHKINGYEIDIWSPSLMLGVEVDGYPWHLGKEKADKQKSLVISELGGRLIHIRHELLPKICESDIFFSGRTPVKQTTDKLVESIARLGYVAIDRCREYLKSEQFINVDRYNEITSWLPNPEPEKSLAYLRPDLALEWLVEDNFPNTPASVTTGSSLKVKWRCPKGHVWAATVSNRARLNSGCPQCSGLKASAQNNASNDPSLKALWDSEKNKFDLNELTPKSKRIVWWKCSRGHSFSMSPGQLTKAYSCPVCTNRRLVPERSLTAVRPALAELWDHKKNGGSDNPTLIPPSTAKKFWWKCLICSHSWYDSPNQMSRRNDEKLCPNWRKHLEE